ncbi:hypothetical protein OIU74_005841 [Salix koriyanagi]|uniref:Amino acid transporter transmembrane domain-containing protein n=1 Tax=Salix koriyanagi TaxID=2511006 RepID=A0A9Q0UCY4_9ROSI|nr:hypothetical protein OIU74_005841 [Salix koriyanagi]
MGVGAGDVESPLLHALPAVRRTGTVWTAAAHIITGVVGSGVLSLAWSMAQLGWIAGPLAMLCFASITLVSTFLLCDCYRSPHPEFGPARNRSYLEAVHTTLGKSKAFLGGLFVQVGLYGTSIAYVVASDTSMRAIQKSNCYHKQGREAACEYEGTLYILLFGAVQLVLSQLPDFHNIQWLSILAAIMSFAYSIIGFALGFAQVIGNGYVKGTIAGVTAYSAADKLWKVSQAIGDIAFAFPYSLIVMEIQDTLKSPPSENKTMKKATAIGIVITTFLYLGCGGFVHLVGAYQVFCQPLFATIEKWIAENHPDSRFVNKNVICKIPRLPDFQLNLLRLCLRTIYVISTTTIAMGFPYFNQVIGLFGGFSFWPLSVYFPVEMYFKQRNIEAWTTKWILLRSFSIICFLVTAFALIGSVEGLIREKIK